MKPSRRTAVLVLAVLLLLVVPGAAFAAGWLAAGRAAGRSWHSIDEARRWFDGWRQNETLAGAFALLGRDVGSVGGCYYELPDFAQVTWIGRDLPTPFLGYAPMPGPLASGNINLDQLRAPRELTQPKPDETYRVFLVGGSTAYGAGASDDRHTVAGYLETLLAAPGAPAAGRRVEVFTAACSGWSSAHERIVVENRIRWWQPDAVVHLTGVNDAQWSSTGSDVNRHRGHQDEFFFGLLNSLLAINFQAPLPHLPAPSAQPVPIEVATMRLVANLELATAALRGSCPVQLICLQPLINRVDKPLTTREQAWCEEHREEHAALAAYLDDFDAALRVWLPPGPTGEPGGAPDLRYLDLRSAFAGITDEVFLDSCHLGDRGNDHVARAIAAALRNR